MRTHAAHRLILVFSGFLYTLALLSQDPGWLPKGAVMAYEVYCNEYVSTIKTVEVTGAYFENNTEVRILESSWINSCIGFPIEVVFILHRKEDRVYYVDTSGVEYLLYDYAALPGDTIKVITNISDVGDPMYTDMMVESIDTLFVQDTFLLVQNIDESPLMYSYGDVIIDLLPTGLMFPVGPLAVPGGGFFAAYVSPISTALCFNASACHLIRTDFDYSPFRTDAGIYYEGSGGVIYSIQLTNPSPESDTIVLNPNSSIVNKGDDCIVVDQFGWAFDRVELNSTTKFSVYNINGDPITILLDRNVGEEWVCYEKGGIEIKAFVKSREKETVIYNRKDSVQTIGFKYPSNPQSNLNSIELKLSKSYGIMQLMSFLHFPDYAIPRLPYEDLKSFKLIGMDFDRDNESYLNTTWKDVHRHKLGDQLHIEKAYTEFGIGSILQDRLTYIGGIYENGSTFHLWSREGRHVVKNGGSDDVINFVRDTLRLVYDANYGKTIGFDTHPGDAIIFDSTAATYSYGGLFNEHSKKTLNPVSWLRVDSCWEEIITFADTYAPTWISRLGGEYYDRSDQSRRDYRELKYYRLNSGEEWGEPFDFTVSTTSPQDALQINIYPNPASDFITIENETLNASTKLEIYDTAGRLRLIENNVSTNPINIRHLEAGLFIYKITAHDQVASGKLVITK